MKTEKSFTVVFLIGLIFKFLHFPGGAVLLIISLTIIAMLYFPMAFYFFSDRELKRQNLALSIVSGFFLSLVPIGIMFKLQYWPGAQLNLLIGTFSALIILAITYFLKSKSSDDLKTYYKNLFLRTTVLLTLGIILCLTPTSTLLKIQYHDDSELARLKIQSYTNPDNQEFREQLDDYLQKKDSFEKK